MSSNGMVWLSEKMHIGCDWCICTDSEYSSKLTGRAVFEGGFDYLRDCSVRLRRGRDGGTVTHSERDRERETEQSKSG